MSALHRSFGTDASKAHQRGRSISMTQIQELAPAAQPRDIGEAPSHFTKLQASLWDEFKRLEPTGMDLMDRPSVELICELAALDREGMIRPGHLKTLRSLVFKFGVRWKDEQFWPRKTRKAVQ
jgi:hypothetical protein